MAAPRVPRRLERHHLPYIVHRRIWAQWITFAYAPLLFALSGFLIIAVTALEMPIGLRLFLFPAALFFPFAAMIALDRSFRYRVVIDHDSVTIRGLIFTRRFAWGEISGFQPRHNFRLPGYFASFTVDGSNHPRRHWSSLWFGFYDIPPLMQFGGKQLTSLLRHAQRRAAAGWPKRTGRGAGKDAMATE